MALVCAFPAVASSSLETAWKSISSIKGFDVEAAPASMFNFPDSFGDGQLAVHPNASMCKEITAVLDALSDDYLLGALSDESFDERLFVESLPDGGCVMLYTIVGTGGADTVAFMANITEEQADEVASLWESHIKQEEEGKEEFDQDFGDE